MKIRIAIVIPVYNHAKTIREVVLRCIKTVEAFHSDAISFEVQPSSIYVVDDGSSDASFDNIKDLDINILRHDVNRGKGAALLTACHTLKEQGFTHFISLDADAQHFPEDLPQFFNAIIQSPYSFIVGARDFSVENIPSSSRFGRKFSKFWMYVQTGVGVSDMQSGYRAYNIEALSLLKLGETRYSFEIEVLVRAAWAGFSIVEIPIHVHYQKGKERVSHFDKIQDNVRISILNTKLTVRALIPVPFQHHALDVESKQELSLLSPMKSLRILLEQSSITHLAFSCGIAFFICLLPLLGIQSILLLLCINTLQLNRLASLIVIPLSWPPFLPAIAMLVGYRVLNGAWLTEFSFNTLYHQFWNRVLDWAVGSLLVAPLCGILLAFLIFTFSKILTHNVKG